MQRYDSAYAGVIEPCQHGQYVKLSDVENIISQYNELRLEKIEDEHTKYLNKRVYEICRFLHHPHAQFSKRHPTLVVNVNTIDYWWYGYHKGTVVYVEGNGHWDQNNEAFETTFPTSWLTIHQDKLEEVIEEYTIALNVKIKEADELSAKEAKQRKIKRLEEELAKLKESK